MQQNKKQLSAVEFILLDKINPKDERFQTRHHAMMLNSTKHNAIDSSHSNVRELAEELRLVIQNSKKKPRQAHLDPVILYKPEGSEQFIVVAGFHRFYAYLLYNKKYARGNGKKKVIPAHLFLGTEAEAELESANQDIRPNLNKSKEEKLNIAWKMVREENHAAERLTARQLAEMCGISKSTVSEMRTTYRKLRKSESITYDNWKVQRFALRSGQKLVEEDQMTKKINHIAHKIITKHLKGDLGNDRQAFQQLLKELSRRAEVKPDGELMDVLGIGIECDDF